MNFQILSCSCIPEINLPDEGGGGGEGVSVCRQQDGMCVSHSTVIGYQSGKGQGSGAHLWLSRGRTGFE